jgi:hypothetical protein
MKRFLIAFLVASVSAGLISSSQAGKPGGGGPTPTGTVFYSNAGQVWAMKPDGTGKVQALPNGWSGTPSDQIYGSDSVFDRWYLGYEQTHVYSQVTYPDGAVAQNVPHYDVIAFRTNRSLSQITKVRLSDLFGILLVTSPATLPVWSNDDNQSTTSYVQCHAMDDIRGAFDPNTGSVDLRNVNVVDLRLPLNASEITATFVPYPDAPNDPAVDAFLLPVIPTALSGIGGPYWNGYSPDGMDFTFCEKIPNTNAYQLEIRDVTTLALLRVVNTGTATRPTYSRFSRDGMKLAFYNDFIDSPGGVWTIPAAGGTPVQLLKNSHGGFNFSSYGGQQWSPDSQFLVAGYYSYNSSKPGNTTALILVPAAGGASTNLTGNLANVNISPIRWVSDTVGGP